MRREADYLKDDEGVLVYIAKKLREAKAIEELLTRSTIDYVVEVDQYVGGFLFRTARAGAFFYVRADAETLTRELLEHCGYRPYEPLE